jgi:hypothetical protein
VATALPASNALDVFYIQNNMRAHLVALLQILRNCLRSDYAPGKTDEHAVWLDQEATFSAK